MFVCSFFSVNEFLFVSVWISNGMESSYIINDIPVDAVFLIKYPLTLFSLNLCVSFKPYPAVGSTNNN